MKTTPEIDRFLSLSEVREMIDVVRQQIWRLRKSGRFPHPVRISEGATRYRLREVVHWMETRTPDSTSPTSRKNHSKPDLD